MSQPYPTHLHVINTFLSSFYPKTRRYVQYMSWTPRHPAAPNTHKKVLWFQTRFLQNYIIFRNFDDVTNWVSHGTRSRRLGLPAAHAESAERTTCSSQRRSPRSRAPTRRGGHHATLQSSAVPRPCALIFTVWRYSNLALSALFCGNPHHSIWMKRDHW